jgi:multiple sugar transport system permease protein
VKPLAKSLLYAGLAFWSFISVFPIYWVAITSFKSAQDIDQPQGYLPFVDYSPSLDAWRFILFDQHENLVSRFINSAVIGGAATVLTLAVSGMAIYGLTRFPPAIRWATIACAAAAIGCVLAAVSVPSWDLRAALLAAALASPVLAIGLRRWGPVMSAFGATALMLSTRVLPPAVLALPLYVLAVATGMRDTLTAMILVYTAINIPVAVWLLLPVLGSRATEQEEAAQLDGASHVSILFSILLPMVRGSVAAAGLIVFLMCWNEYLFAAYLTDDHALTLPPWAVGQLSMKEAQVGGGAEELAHLSAATILMMLPALAFCALVQKQLSRSVFWRAQG